MFQILSNALYTLAPLIHTTANEIKYNWYPQFTDEEAESPDFTWSLSNLPKVMWQMARKMAEMGFEPREYDTRTSLLAVPPSHLFLLIALWREMKSDSARV